MARRVVFLVGALVIFFGAVFGYVFGYVLQRPQPYPGVTAGSNSSPTTDIKLETVGAVSGAIKYPRSDPHPDWVAYLPTTVLIVPTNSTVHVTIYQEDSATGLRNPFWGKIQGLVGGGYQMTYYDNSGKKTSGFFTQLDPSLAAHTFAIPDLGVFVPLMGVSANAPAGAINTITFSFRTHSRGIYRWQCFVPCAAGSLFGNGGAMSTYGYMGGELVVK